MIGRTLVFTAVAALSTNASALDIAGFLGASHEHYANYEYAEGSVLFQPNSFKGFELRGSRSVQSNVALIGVFSRVSADVGRSSITDTTIGVGARYFFALESQDIENTDVDLSASLVNSSLDLSGASDSATGLLLKTQVRHMLNRPLGSSAMSLEEVYGGVRLGLYSGDSNAAIHGGLLLKINQQFSARAELSIDDGSYVSLGVRMKLGQPQRNPEGAKSRSSSAMAPVIVPASPAPALVPAPATNQKPGKSDADPYGLSEDEMEGLKANTD